MVDDGRSEGRVGFVLQFALGIYMNLSYPGCLEARDAPAVPPSTAQPRKGLDVYQELPCGVEARHVILGDPLKPPKPEASHMKNS